MDSAQHGAQPPASRVMPAMVDSGHLAIERPELSDWQQARIGLSGAIRPGAGGAAPHRRVAAPPNHAREVHLLAAGHKQGAGKGTAQLEGMNHSVGGRAGPLWHELIHTAGRDGPRPSGARRCRFRVLARAVAPRSGERPTGSAGHRSARAAHGRAPRVPADGATGRQLFRTSVTRSAACELGHSSPRPARVT